MIYLKLKKHLNLLIVIVLSLVSFWACTPDDDNENGDIRAEYVGSWTCSEQSSLFGQSTYSVTISYGPSDNTVLIYNLYNIGASEAVEVYLVDNSLELLNQTVDNNLFSGEGTSVVDYSTFNLSYSVKSAGDQDQVSATFTQ